jgi:hypothetical protein
MLQKFTPLASLVKANACQFLQQSLAGHSKLRASLKPKFFSCMNNQRACKKQFFTKNMGSGSMLRMHERASHGQRTVEQTGNF